MAYDHNRVIVHLDIDAFYAQVEEMLNPELKTKPVGIYQKTIIVTSNYVAREYGIKKCMLTSEAIKLCPNMILVNGENLEKYRDISQNITKFLQNTYNVEVEKLGFDENFLDVTKLVENKMNENSNEILVKYINDDYDKETDSDEDFSTESTAINEKGSHIEMHTHKRKSCETQKEKFKKIKLETFQGSEQTTRSSVKSNLNTCEVVGHTYRNMKGKCHCGCVQRLILGTHIANDIRKEVFNHFKLTLSGGISYNKLLSKLVGSIHKPNQQTVIFPNAVLDLMSNVQLRQIPGIGSKMFEKLASIHISTIEKLQNADKHILMKTFDASTSEWLSNISYGKDSSCVKNFKKQNSIGVEDRYPKPINNIDEFKKQTKILVKRLLILIKKDGRTPKLLKIHLRFDHFKYEFKFDSKQCQINPKIFCQNDVNITEYLLHTIVKLYKELSMKKNSNIVTYINVALGNFIEISKNSILKFCEKKSLNENRNSDSRNFNHSLKFEFPTYAQEPVDSHQDMCSKNGGFENEFSKGDLKQIKNIDGIIKKTENNKDQAVNPNFCSLQNVSNDAELNITEQSSPSFIEKIPSTSFEKEFNATLETISTTSIHTNVGQTKCGQISNTINNKKNLFDNTTIDEDVFKELPEEIQKEIIAFMSREENKKQNETVCPERGNDVIDEDVLNSLPENIRKEIEDDMKRVKYCGRKVNQTSKSIKQLSILNYVTKK